MLPQLAFKSKHYALTADAKLASIAFKSHVEHIIEVDVRQGGHESVLAGFTLSGTAANIESGQGPSSSQSQVVH